RRRCPRRRRAARTQRRAGARRRASRAHHNRKSLAGLDDGDGEALAVVRRRRQVDHHLVAGGVLELERVLALAALHGVELFVEPPAERLHARAVEQLGGLRRARPVVHRDPLRRAPLLGRQAADGTWVPGYIVDVFAVGVAPLARDQAGELELLVGPHGEKARAA